MALLKVYLAGPDVFRIDAVSHGKKLKEALIPHNLEGLYPFDNEVPQNIKNPAIAIRAANEKMIFDCDAVLANLDRFRSPSLDPGTAYEIGFAAALGKPIFGYYTRVGLLTYEQQSRAMAKMPYFEVEKFGLTDNLMIACSLQNAPTTLEEAIKSCDEYLHRS